MIELGRWRWAAGRVTPTVLLSGSGGVFEKRMREGDSVRRTLAVWVPLQWMTWAVLSGVAAEACVAAPPSAPAGATLQRARARDYRRHHPLQEHRRGSIRWGKGKAGGAGTGQRDRLEGTLSLASCHQDSTKLPATRTHPALGRETDSASQDKLKDVPMERDGRGGQSGTQMYRKGARRWVATGAAR